VHDGIAGTTPFMFAIQKNNVESVQALWNAKASIDAEDEDGYTPAMFAVQSHSFEHNRWLILDAQKKGFSIDHQNTKKVDLLEFLVDNDFTSGIDFILTCGATVSFSHIFRVVKQNNMKNLERLLTVPTLRVNHHFGNGWTPLIIAGKFGNRTAVEFLLKLGAEVEKHDAGGMSALNHASVGPDDWLKDKISELAFKPDFPGCIDALLKAGADINNKSKDAIFFGGTPLIHAVLRVEPNIVKRLLMEKQNLNHIAQDSSGQKMTAFSACQARNHPECFRALISAAKESKQHIEDFTLTLDQAIYNGSLDSVQLLLSMQEICSDQIQYAFLTAANVGQTQIMQWFNSKGADPNRPDSREKGGNTALMLAANGGHVESVKCLIEMGAKVNATSPQGASALLYAGIAGHTPVVKILLEHKASVHLGDEGHCTVLHFGAGYNRKDLINLLCETKDQTAIDFNVEMNNGFTAIDLTTDPQIAKILKKHGSKAEGFNCQSKLIACMILTSNLRLIEHYLEVLDPNLYPICPLKAIPQFLLRNHPPIFSFSNYNGFREVRFLVLRYKLYANYQAQSREKIDRFVTSLSTACHDFKFSMEGDLIIRMEHNDILYKLSLSVETQCHVLSLSESPDNFSEILIQYSLEFEAIAKEKRSREFINQIFHRFLKANMLIMKPQDTLTEWEKNPQFMDTLKSDKVHSAKTKLKEASLQKRTTLDELYATFTQQKLFESNDAQLFQGALVKLDLILRECEEEIEGPWSSLKDLIFAKKQQFSEQLAKADANFSRRQKGGAIELKADENLKGTALQSKLLALEEQRKAYQPPKSTVKPVKKVYLPPKPEPKIQTEEFWQRNNYRELRIYLKGPKLHSLDFMGGNVSGHLRALEGRDQMSSTLVHISEIKSNTETDLIAINAAKGALAQVLESRKMLQEDWPNKIRNVVFKFEEFIDRFLKNNKADLPSIVKSIQANLDQFPEQALLTGKAKLALSDIDTLGFLQALYEANAQIPAYDEKRARDFVQKSEQELAAYKKFIIAHSKNAAENEALKQAIGFTLARIGNYLIKMHDKGIHINKEFAPL